MVTTTQKAPERLSAAPSDRGLRSFVRARPVFAFFSLTFLISWGGVLLFVAASFGRLPVPVEEFDAFIPFALLITVAGPALAGPVLTALVDGRPGLRELRARLFRRLSARWWALGLFGAPLAVLAVLLPLSLISSDFLPAIATTDAKIGLLLGGVAAGVAAGVLEEVGWTGFAVPRLRARHGVLAAGLLLGVVWGVWHFLVYAAGSGTPTGGLDWAAFLPPVVFFLAVLPVFRVIMIWAHDRTQSVSLAMVLHGSLSATAPVILAPEVTGAGLAAYYLALGALLWVLVAVGAWMRGNVGSSSKRTARSVQDGARRVRRRFIAWRAVRDALRLIGVVLAAAVSRRSVRPVADEDERSLPGDELVPDAKVGWTHAITIGGRPAAVWPWLAQMGCRRAGWYSYDGLDNGGVRSADRILPGIQDVEVGDVFPMTPTADDRFVVRAVEPERVLVLGDDAGSMSWAFVLEPAGERDTRLITRSRGAYDRLALGLMLKAIWHPVHFGMQRRQLLSLKRLVEAAA